MKSNLNAQLRSTIKSLRNPKSKIVNRHSPPSIVILKSYIVNLLLTATCLLSFQLKGQDYPVQITTTLTPPYSLYLAEYATPDRPALQVIINLKELDRSEYKVKLRLTIEGQGITLRTKPGYLPQPLILQGGLPEILTGNEISNYLNPNNLDFSGISKQDFLKRGTFPEGFYTFKIEAVDYNRDVVVSNAGLANAWLILNDPPLINLPFNNDKIVATDPQNVLFSWTPRHTASPNAAFTTEYEFKLVELYPTNRNPNDAILSSNSIYVTTTSATSLNYGAADPLLIPGRRYAFRVRAYDTEGRDLFKNNGYSETYVFQFGDACTPPINVKGEALDDARIKLIWESGDAHTGFDFQYKREDKSEWWKENTLSDFAIIPGLNSNTTYQYQVRGRCGTLFSDYTLINTVKTKDKKEDAFVCGADVPPFEIKTTPLKVPLHVGDEIKTADFDIVLLEVTKNANDTYKGTGSALMPWLNMAKVRVKFNNIRVNEDYRVYDGRVSTIYSTDSRFVVNVDVAKGEAKETYNGNQQQKFEGQEITYAGDIKTIAIDATTGNIIITKEDGTTETIARPKDSNGNIKDAKITDSNGDSWVVNKDGTIQQGPSTAAPDAVASMDAINFNVTFTPNPQQNYGYDAKDEKLKASYETIKVKGEDYTVAWKAVETGRQEVVNAQTSTQNNFPNSVGFKTATGPAPSQAATTTGQKQIFITGKTNDDTEALTAYVKVKEPNKEEQEVEVGRLNITTYDKILNKLYIVPVNDATAPSTQQLNEELNKIYWQAVAGWDVSVDSRFTVDPEAIKGLDDGMSGMLTSFPPKMLSLNRMFTNDPNRFVDNDAYYIFLIQGSDAKRSGFMPFKRKFGYIFLNNASNVITAIAHELGHGAFRLYHTFSNDDYHAAESTTDNLMDYNGGTTLKKYQWDNVHSPQSLISWLKDDDESALTNKPFFVDYKSRDIIIHVDQARNHKITYLTPAGKPFEVSETASLSFTGQFKREDGTIETINCPAGSLLAFQDETGTWVASIVKKQGIYFFNGYVNANSKNEFKEITLEKNNAVIAFIGKEDDYCNMVIYYGDYASIIDTKSSYRGDGEVSMLTSFNLNDPGEVGRFKLDDCVPNAAYNLPPVPNNLFTNNIYARYNYYKDGGVLLKLSNGEYFYSNVDDQGNPYYKRWVAGAWVPYNPAQPNCTSCDLKLILSIHGIMSLFKEVGHDVLDAGGLVPMAGEVFDGINGVWYAIEGDAINAGVSFSSAVPIIGWASTGGKWIVKYSKVGKVLKNAGKFNLVDFKNPLEEIVKRMNDLGFDEAATNALNADLHTVLKVGSEGSPDVLLLDKFIENPGLVGAWKKMKDANADEVLRKNSGALEALNKPKFDRPAPETYLDSDYITNHLSKFDGGVRKFVSNIPTGAVGPPSGTFVMPKSQADQLISQAGRDINKLEDLLGLDRGTLGENPIRLDIDKPAGLRMSSGNELGAIEKWIPGGKTSGGTLEATVDQIQPGTYLVHKVY